MLLKGFQRGFAVLLLVAVAVAGNLHLPFVQAVAWTRMYACYREHFTAREALQITFSGQYPCSLCKAVASAEAERNKSSEILFSSERALLIPLPHLAVFSVAVPPSQMAGCSEPYQHLPSVLDAPETPPPKLA